MSKQRSHWAIERQQQRREAKKRRKLRAARGEAPEKLPQTLESTRVYRTDLDWGAELPVDEATVAAVLRGERLPRVMITTSVRPEGKQIYDFIGDLLFLFPSSVYRERGKRDLEQVCAFAVSQGFTDVLVIAQGKGMTLRYLVHIRLPDGPLYMYRLSSIVCSESIAQRGAPTLHHSEVVTSNFRTELGRHIERSLSALFPNQDPQSGRQVVLIRNQRDYIFFRFHRYVFTERHDTIATDRVQVRTQELGPRFTLKLLHVRQLFGDPEPQWIWKRSREVNTGKRVFAM
jgi:ribosome production factor 1